jgi:hypothetical protein
METAVFNTLQSQCMHTIKALSLAFKIYYSQAVYPAKQKSMGKKWHSITSTADYHLYLVSAKNCGGGRLYHITLSRRYK